MALVLHRQGVSRLKLLLTARCGLRKGTGALDKEKGVVKGKDILSGAEHRLLWTPERVGPRLWGYHRFIIFSGGSLHRAIDTTETTIMIFLFGHPAAESVRKWETPEVFSKALAPSSA
jgi:hypothetical protein